MANDQDQGRGDLTSRGVAWQAVGFVIVGIAVLTIKHVFSASDAWQYGLFIFAATNLYWAFALMIAYVIDWSRKMFETKAQIRAEALQKSFQKGQKAGIKAGREEGLEAGLEAGREAGREEGREAGLKAGREQTTARYDSLIDEFSDQLPPEFLRALDESKKNGKRRN